MQEVTQAKPSNRGADIASDHACEDRADYARFLAEYGLSPEWVAAVSSNPDDQIPMPDGFDKIAPGDSAIHGLGMFATVPIDQGAVIAPARIAGKRTPAGRYTNHSPQPNAEFIRLSDDRDGDLNLVALRAIAEGAEVLIDYRQACSVNGAGIVPVHAVVPPSRAETEAIAAFLALPMREQMASLIADVLADSEFCEQCNIEHTVENGMYMRKMFIRKDELVIGRMHKLECINICASGAITITTEKGSMDVRAGFTAVSPPGIMKIGRAREDTVWINAFRTDETDLDKLDALIAYNKEETLAMLDPECKYFNVKELSCHQQ